MRKLCLFGSTIVTSAALMAGASHAAEEGAAASAPEEIVVTGTLIRGAEPVGTNVLDIDEAEIQKIGATDATQLLARIPQLNSFSQLPTPIGNNAGIIRPPLVRGLPTLVLFNGQRMAPVGLLASDPNVNAIPPSLIERVEVIPGGGSALYGSDAIGGVVNFIARSTIDGFEFSGRGGIGDDYDTRAADFAYGKAWDSGSLIAAYSYDHHSNLAGRDRDWFTQDPLHTGFTNTLCSPGNVTANGQTYALPNVTAGARTCDGNDYFDIYPEYDRNSVYFSLKQDIGSAMHFDGTAWFAEERLKSSGTYLFGDTNLDASGTITSANPYFRSIAGESRQTFSQILDDVGAPYGLGRNDNTYTTLGITPKLTIDLPKDWRAVASFNYGRSEVDTESRNVNNAALAAALASSDAATAYNPYDPRTTNPAVLRAILGTAADVSSGTQTFTQSRLVFDGAMASLPGGELKMAVGYERLTYKISAGNSLNVPYDADVTEYSSKRDINSAFAELSVPLVGDGNARTGIRKLELSAAVRYDDFSDGFDTTNPKFGVTYEPFASLTLRGNWGKSFHAPDLAYTTGVTQTQVRPATFIMFPADIPQFGNPERLEFILAGANPGQIEPETSTAWQIGADFAPEALPGLSLSATYFAIKFDKRIDYPPLFPPGVAAQSFFLLQPTLEQLVAATQGFEFDAPVDLASLYADPQTTPYALITAYPQNIANVRMRGIDFDVGYRHPTSFGSAWTRVVGTRILKQRTQGAPTVAYSSDLSDGTPKLTAQAAVGVEVGAVLAEVRVDYRGSSPLANSPLIPTIDSYTTTNVFLSYDFGEVGALNEMQLTLNADNVFDKDPPIRFGATGTAFTSLGRVVTLGLRTSF